MICSYLKSKDGATSIEYGLIAAGVALGIAGALFAFGDDLSDVLFSGSVMLETIEEANAVDDITAGVD